MSHLSSESPYLSRGIRAFIQAVEKENAPPLYTLSPAAAREVLEGVQSNPIEKFEVDLQSVILPVGPTGVVQTFVLRPPGVEGKLPVIVYFHGGGWVLGGLSTHDRLVRELCVRTDAALVFVEYTPSPEAQYPVPCEQAYAALAHLGQIADAYSLDSERLAVAGDSVGGNMAIVASLLAKERGGPKIRLQLLFYPVTDATMDTPSYEQFANGPWLTRRAMEWFWDQYLPDKSRREEVTASPLRGSAEELAGLPPALVITAENDVLRDEGEAFARRLDEAGISAACLRLNGTIHDFVMLDALAREPTTRAAMKVATGALKRALASR